MADLSISGIRERIFNPTKHEPQVARQSNPFSNMKFKNVLTADVFEPSFKGGSAAYRSTNKLKLSALVSSISDLGSRIRAGIESINAFGERMKEGFINTWNTINSVTIGDIGHKIGESVSSIFEYSGARGLAKRPVSELREMFVAAEHDMAHAGV